MKKDPTKTLYLRNALVAQINKRFAQLKKELRKLLITNDAFGLKKIKKQKLFNIKEWAYRSDPEKVDEFVKWLKSQSKAGILERVKNPITGELDPWINSYIQTAYQKGILSARNELIAEGIELPPVSVGGVGISVAFNQPIHVSKLKLLYTRIFSDLEGVTEVMSRQMSRVLSLGLAEGKGIYQIAKELADRVNKIGITRARLIARTEIVRTYNIGALNEYEVLEPIIGEKILVQWWTALDERVRSAHANRHGKIYIRKKAEGLLGEPNCRCALLPYMKSISGDPKKVAKRENRIGKAKIKKMKEKEG